MSQRINIVVQDKTVAVLDRLTTKANRGRVIDRLVQGSVQIEGKENLRTRLKEESIENAERDLAMAAEWSPLEEEAAQRLDTSRSRKPARKRT